MKISSTSQILYPSARKCHSTSKGYFLLAFSFQDWFAFAKITPFGLDGVCLWRLCSHWEDWPTQGRLQSPFDSCTHRAEVVSSSLGFVFIGRIAYYSCQLLVFLEGSFSLQWIVFESIVFLCESCLFVWGLGSLYQDCAANPLLVLSLQRFVFVSREWQLILSF